jgi:hypothetical protein
MGRTEYEHWDRRTGKIRHAGSIAARSSIGSARRRDQSAEFVSADHCVFDDREATLRFVPAPRHTIGNTMIDLRADTTTPSCPAM